MREMNEEAMKAVEAEVTVAFGRFAELRGLLDDRERIILDLQRENEALRCESRQAAGHASEKSTDVVIHLQSQLERATARAQALQQQLTVAKGEQRRLRDSVGRLSSQLEAARHDVATNQDALAQKDGHLKQLQQQLALASQQVQDLQREVAYASPRAEPASRETPPPYARMRSRMRSGSSREAKRAREALLLASGDDEYTRVEDAQGGKRCCVVS